MVTKFHRILFQCSLLVAVAFGCTLDTRNAPFSIEETGPYYRCEHGAKSACRKSCTELESKVPARSFETKDECYDFQAVKQCIRVNAIGGPINDYNFNCVMSYESCDFPHADGSPGSDAGTMNPSSSDYYANMDDCWDDIPMNWTLCYHTFNRGDGTFDGVHLANNHRVPFSDGYDCNPVGCDDSALGNGGEVVLTNIPNEHLCDAYSPETLYRCVMPISGLVTCRPTPCLDGESTDRTVIGSVDDCLNYYQGSSGPAICACVNPETGDKQCRSLTSGESCCGDDYSIQSPNDGAFFINSAACTSYTATASFPMCMRENTGDNFYDQYYAFCSTIPESCDSPLWPLYNNGETPSFRVLKNFYSPRECCDYGDDNVGNLFQTKFDRVYLYPYEKCYIRGEWANN